MVHVLRAVDLALVEVGDGEAGLAAAAALRPDLILLDMHRPGASGYEVAARLKAGAATREMPLIAVTADAGTADEDRGRRAGCDGYLAKPFRPAQLLAAIRRLLPC